MTFAEARNVLRQDILAEASTAFYSDAALLSYLTRAAQELAYVFGFPTQVDTVTVAAGDSTFDLPEDAANLDLNEVAYDGFVLALVPYRVIAQYVNQIMTGLPRYYNYDPKRADKTVYFAPAAPRESDIAFEYIVAYEIPDEPEDEAVWDGLFVAYHDLVVFRAAVKAFDASLETERAAYWLQREQQRAQEFALFLNKAPMDRALGQGANES